MEELKRKQEEQKKLEKKIRGIIYSTFSMFALVVALKLKSKWLKVRK